ncbi:MAG: hypothetical protein U1E59_14130 [Amaricoccus sp.]
MIPDAIQAFIEAVKDGAAGGRLRAARGAPPRRRRSGAARALGELVLPALADPGAAAKVAELQQRVAAEHASARKARAEAAAAGAATARQAVLAGSARRVEAALARAALAPDVVPRWFVIQRPFLIWPTGIVLDDSQTVDLQSYARFRVYTDIDGDDAGHVRFYYYWTNPYPDPVFVSLASIGDWNGACDVYLDGGLFNEDTAGLYVSAELEVLPVWEPQAAWTTEATWPVFAASQQNRGLWSGYWEAAEATQGGAALGMADLLIPATRTVIFTMTVMLSSYVYGDGGATADYSTEGYAFRSPAAVVTVTGRVVSP